MTASEVRRLLRENASPEKAAFLPRFFRTGPGEYGEGDRFYGVVVPDCRRIARAARDLRERDLDRLLSSPIHEERTVALLVMADRFERGDESERLRVYRLYRRKLGRVNNWDLVDGSAPTIVGGYFEGRGRSQLYRWARSKKLWERRIAIVATYRYIKNGDFTDALAIARILRDDEEDLIHKAVGWMLRAEERFLRAHQRKMPRTMLRYAIEKFPAPLRKAYSNGRPK
ncbi:MAG: DNA alkylation repair protein [Vicinamibacteria bacterium]